MIALAYKVERYRELLASRVDEGDVVVEIGPHTGKSTVSYIKKTKLTVAVDKAKQSRGKFKSLLREHENLRFVVADVRSFSAIRKVLKLTKECDILAIDMGGGRFPDTVFKVWATWSGIFKPRHSIIRSRGLAEFLRRAKVQDSTIPTSFADDGWLSTFGRGTPYRLRKQLNEFRYWVNINKPLQ